MLKNIEQEFLSTQFADLSEDYIAIALYINGQGIGEHAGILISIGGELKLFHFVKEVLIEAMEDVKDGNWFYSKKIDLIYPEEVLTFLSHCELIEENASPKWAFVFDGSYYSKETGLYFTKSGLSEYSTCVGFCINVISGFLNGPEYFDLDSWNESSLEVFRQKYKDFYDDLFTKFEAENPEQIGIVKQNYWKRITPTEYASSAFLNVLPITKVDIEPLNPIVEKYIYEERQKDDSF